MPSSRVPRYLLTEKTPQGPATSRVRYMADPALPPRPHTLRNLQSPRSHVTTDLFCNHTGLVPDNRGRPMPPHPRNSIMPSPSPGPSLPRCPGFFRHLTGLAASRSKPFQPFPSSSNRLPMHCVLFPTCPTATKKRAVPRRSGSNQS